MNIFDKCTTKKEQGNIGEGYAMAYFMSQNIKVSKPLTEDQNYDLIINYKNELKTIQVKTTSLLTGVNNDIWIVRINSSYLTVNGAVQNAFNNKSVGFLFIVTSYGGLYFIPSNEITSKHTFNLNPLKYNKYRVFLKGNSVDYNKDIDLKKENKKLLSENENLSKENKNLKSKINSIIRNNNLEYKYGSKEMTEARRENYISMRKNDRPSYEKLISDVDEQGLNKTAEKYDVTSNTIKKWIKWYENHE